MSKKGFLASLIIAIVATVALSIYTIVSVCLPAKGGDQNGKIFALAFRQGEVVEELKGYTENEDLTFSVEEGKENPLEYDAEQGAYVTKDMNSSVTAVISKKGGDITYKISVYHHNELGLSEDEPYIVTKKAHLADLKEKLEVPVDSGEKSEPTYISLVSDIDLAGENWKPIGTTINSANGITFNGNGHTIKNMTINVTSENYTEYLSLRAPDVSGSATRIAYMEIGFFGRVKAGSTIKNLKMDGTNITVSSEVYEILATATQGSVGFDECRGVSIGSVAGIALESVLENVEVSSKIKAFSYSKYGWENGIGGILGTMTNTKVNNSKANLTFEDVLTHSVSDNDTIKSTYVGGGVGYASTFESDANYVETDLANKNTIDGCETTVSATTLYQNVTYIAGLVAYAENASIKNSVVKSFKAVDPYATSKTIDTSISRVSSAAGAVGKIFTTKLENCPSDKLQSFASEIVNVKVESVDITILGGIASGLVAYAGTAIDANIVAGTTMYIKDCSVNGSLTARIASGFVGRIGKEAEVVFGDEFDGNAVSGVVSGYSANAFADEIYGKVIGNVGKTAKVAVTMKGKGANVAEATSTKIPYRDTYVTAFGFAYETSSIENMSIAIDASSMLSFAGVVFNSKGATIKNCDVTANVTSYTVNKNGVNRSTTYMVAGVVGNAYEGTTVENVSASINLNQGVNKNTKYGANYFGGVVARIHDNNVTITSNTVVANVYVNDAFEEIGFYPSEGTALIEYGKVFLAGGVVGSIQKRGDADTDAFATVDTSNVKIENNSVSFVIDVDFVDNSWADGDRSQAFRVRAVGALVGNINSAIALGTKYDLSTNAVTNYNVTADKATFTYGNGTVGTMAVSVNTLGLNQNGQVVYTYGIASMLAGDAYINDVADLTNATYTARA